MNDDPSIAATTTLRPREARRCRRTDPQMAGGETLFDWIRMVVDAVRRGHTEAVEMAVGAAPWLHGELLDVIEDGRFPLTVLLEAAAARQPWSAACGVAFARIARGTYKHKRVGNLGVGAWTFANPGRGDALGLAMAGESPDAMQAALVAALGQTNVLEVQARLSLDAPGLPSVHSLRRDGRMGDGVFLAIEACGTRLGEPLILQARAAARRIADALLPEGGAAKGDREEAAVLPLARRLLQRYPAVFDETFQTRALHRDPVRLLVAVVLRDLDGCGSGSMWQRWAPGAMTRAVLGARLASGSALLGSDERLLLTVLRGCPGTSRWDKRVVGALLRRDLRAGGRMTVKDLADFMRGAGRRGSIARQGAMVEGLIPALGGFLLDGSFTAADYPALREGAHDIAGRFARRCFCRSAGLPDSEDGKWIGEVVGMDFASRLAWLRAVLVDTDGGVAAMGYEDGETAMPWWGDGETIEAMMRTLPGPGIDTFVESLGAINPRLVAMASGVSAKDLSAASGPRRRRLS